MIFNIHRTSTTDTWKQPCEGAIQRNPGKPPWTITIDTIEELAALQRKVGEPLIVRGDSIEVYDEYRE